MKKVIVLLLSLLFLLCCLMIPAYSHSGRTDSNGGHKDNNNVSGLGSYHYHHGNGPHLHLNGICPYSPKDTIVVNNMPKNIDVGDSLALTWTIIYYSGNSSVEWTSSDDKILSVSNGVLTSKSQVTATITATMKNGTKTFSISVNNVVANKLIITNKITNLEIRRSCILNCDIEPLNTTDKSIIWSSSNDEIVTVKDGQITAITEGKATISAKSANGIYDEYEIEIFAIHPKNIVVNNVDIVKLEIGKQMNISANVEPSNASYSEIIWKSENENIAKVNNGLILGSSVGNTNIVLQCDDIFLTIPIEIYEINPTEINVSNDSLMLSVNDKLQLYANVLPNNSTYKNLIWDSSDSSVVIVDSKGYISCIHEGNAIISIMSHGLIKDISVSVNNINVEDVFVKFSCFDLFGKKYIDKNKKTTIELEIIPKNSTYKDIQIISSDNSVLKIDGYVMIPQQAGTVDITFITHDTESTVTVNIIDFLNFKVGLLVGLVIISSAIFIIIRQKKKEKEV